MLKSIWAAVKNFFARSAMSPEERYYASATDLADLEQRMTDWSRMRRSQCGYGSEPWKQNRYY